MDLGSSLVKLCRFTARILWPTLIGIYTCLFGQNHMLALNYQFNAVPL